MNILLNKIEHIEYTPEQLEERRKLKNEAIDKAYKKQASEVKKAAKRHHIPGQPPKMGGPGSRIQDWEIGMFDKANIDREFPELIKESLWYTEGIYKNDVFFPDLDLYLYGDEDRFVYTEEEWNKLKEFMPKGFYNQNDIKKAKEMVRKKEAYTDEENIIFYDDVINTNKNMDKKLSENFYKTPHNTLGNKKIGKNWSYTIKEGEHAGKTLWSGRYCAVTGIVYCKVNFTHTNLCDIYILAEKRGNGTPDYQGYWCLPCGFLEADESGQEGISRETLEETGIKINRKLFNLIGVQTNPEKSNNGHVTLRYAAEVETMETPNYVNINGENNEVADVRWINLTSIDGYKWAFGHDELLKNYFSKQDYLIRNFDKKPKIELIGSELI